MKTGSIHRSIVSLLLLMCCSSGLLHGVNEKRRSQVDVPQNGTVGMPYLLHLPDEYTSNPDKYYPALIYLHGWGERCSSYHPDVEQLDRVKNANNTPPNHIEGENGNPGHPMGFMVDGQMEYFIVISPQIREGKPWNAADVIALLDEVSAEIRIDPDKVCITGFSFGGTGVWSVLKEPENNPNRFAAAAPVHGWNNNYFDIIADRNVAIWNFGGTNDSTVHMPERILLGSRNMRHEQPEAEIITTMKANTGHNPAHAYTTNNSHHPENLYQWFLRQRLQAPGSASLNNLSDRPETVVTTGDEVGNTKAINVKNLNANSYWVSDTPNYANKWVQLDLGSVHSVEQIYLRFANSTNAAIKPVAPHGSITSVVQSPTTNRIRIYSQGHGLRERKSGQNIPGDKIKIKDSALYDGGAYQVLKKNDSEGWFEIERSFSGTSTGTWYALHETVVDYRLEISVNGADWTTIAEVTDNYEFSKQHKFEPIPIRYARLSILDGNRMILPEFEHIAKVSQFWLLESTEPIDLPAMPEGLTVTNLTSGGATLQWNSPSAGAASISGYKVYWSTDAVRPATPGADLPGGDLSYAVGGLSPDTNYNFWLTAYNAGGESPEASATAMTLGLVPPIAPTGLIASGTGVNEVSLTWNDQSDNEQGFRIYWNTTAVKPAVSGLEVGQSEQAVQVGSLELDTLYYFWVSSYNVAGESSSATASASTAALPVGLDVGLVSYWKFDELSGDIMLDATGLENATRQGHAARVDDGLQDRAISLDGNNDWVEVPHRTEYSGSALSISMWIRPNSVDTQPRGLISKRAGPTAAQRCFSIFTHTGSRVWVDIGNQRTDTGYTLEPSSEWRHFAMVFDGSVSTDNIHLYLDGQEVSVRTTASTSIPEIVSPLTIGILNTNYGSGLSGSIDEVRIYDRALQEEEIITLSQGVTSSGSFEESYALWALGFSSGVSESERVPTADPDGDGLINLLEYALGSDPESGSTQHEPIVETVQQDGKHYLQVSTRRLKGGEGDMVNGYTVGGMLYVFRTSTTLETGSWQSGSSFFEQIDLAEDNGDGTETVTVRLRIAIEDESPRFVHLHVSADGVAGGDYTLPDTTETRLATIDDALFWPTVNEGDYLIFGKNALNNSVYLTNNHVPNLPVGKKIHIWQGEYGRIFINGANCQNTVAQPTIVTNLGGQVVWGNHDGTSLDRSLELHSFDHVHLTGKYDPAQQTGDPGYLGHHAGAAMDSGNYYENYGLWGHQRWSGERILDRHPNVVRIQHFKTCKVDYVAAWGGGFASFNIKTNIPADEDTGEPLVEPERVEVDVQDCFAGFTDGEGFYISYSSSAYGQNLTKLTMRNNIIVFAGTEALQTDNLTEGSVIENNVVIGSSTTFRDPFQDYHQDGLHQLSFVEGGVTVAKNIMAGGVDTMQTVRYKNPGAGRAFPSADSAISINNNYLGFTRSKINYIFGGGDETTPYEFIGNIYGPVSVPQANDAYIIASGPSAQQEFSEDKNSILIQDNVYSPALPAHEISAGSGVNYTFINTLYGVTNYAVAPVLKFMDLGFVDGVDLRRFTRWSATYDTAARAGEYISYEEGDIVIWYDHTGPEAGITKMYQCVDSYTGSVGNEYEPGLSPSKWQQLIWNGNNLPPFDVRFKPDTYYNYRGMGLTYNPVNQYSPDLEAPVISLIDGNISIVVGSPFVEPGYSAMDNADGDLTGQVVESWIGEPLDVNQTGQYLLRYDIQDLAGNQAASQYRIITVSDVSITYGTTSKINMHRDGAFNSPDWTNLGNDARGLQYHGIPTNTNLYDTSGYSTGWHMLIENINFGYSEHSKEYTNSVGREIGDFPAAVTRQGIKLRNPWENPCVFVLTGLNPSKYYEVTFTGYKEGSIGELESTLTDSATGEGETIYIENNSDEIGMVPNAQPDSTGRLDLVFSTATPSGEPNIGGLIIKEKSGFGFPPTLQQTPYGGVAWAIPGVIQAEDYDEGGEGLAYHDTILGNAANKYRTDDVDIENTADVGGGHNVGWIGNGEWLEYTVNVGHTGTYDLNLRVARSSGGSTPISMSVDGADVTGPIAISSTGGWQVWATVTVNDIPLTIGQHVIRLGLNSGYNLNWFELIQSGS